MRTAAEIREAIKRKRARAGRVRTMDRKLGGASKTYDHVSNRDFDLTAGSLEKGKTK